MNTESAPDGEKTDEQLDLVITDLDKSRDESPDSAGFRSGGSGCARGYDYREDEETDADTFMR